jgi:hypothetical protein
MMLPDYPLNLAVYLDQDSTPRSPVLKGAGENRSPGDCEPPGFCFGGQALNRQIAAAKITKSEGRVGSVA